MHAKRAVWLSIFILLVYFFSRVNNAASFPIFIDETIHIHYGERMLEIGSPIYDDIGRLFTIWWLLPFQPAQAAPVWIARIAIVLVTLPGIAALLAIGQMKAKNTGLMAVGLLIVSNTYLLFFGRMALADPAANSLIAVALYFALRLSKQVNTREAVLTGGFLFAAYGFKVASVYFGGIPILAALMLKPKDRQWREQWRWLAWSMGTYTALFVLFNVGLYILGHSALLTGIRYALTGSATTGGSLGTLLALPDRILTNASVSFAVQAHYAGSIVFSLLLLACVVLLLRREFFLPLTVLIPLLAIWAQSAQNSRYFITPATLLLLIGAIVLSTELNRLSSKWRGLILACVGAVLLLQWIPFFQTTIHNPAALELAERDRDEHIRSDAGSFGFRQVHDTLNPLAPEAVYGLLANCQGLRYLSLNDFPVACPRVNPNGEDIPALGALLDANRRPGAYAVVEDSPYVPDSAPGTLLAVIEDSTGRPALSVYDLAP
ncbi:MAG: hypothetical protein JXN59_00320 [Anaerolineae bacterium]|nr:hypothetical protein [Anaerolineae bacterium]